MEKIHKIMLRQWGLLILVLFAGSIVGAKLSDVVYAQQSVPTPVVATSQPTSVQGTVISNQGTPSGVANAWPIAAQPYPVGSTPVQNSSSIVANTTSTATLPAAAAKTTYLSGFTINATGATTGACTAVTVTGTFANHAYIFCVPTGVTSGAPALNMNFNPPIPANAANTTISISMGGVGSGSTGQIIEAWGFQQ